ncbi:hypothetical protein PLESTB_001729200 [Pleodorina starrii]|uniref:Uncharacterized protein n=1 Tax=Pleodorina starrii TaxID=330485 RepID=A0A9W6BZW7_9CHLO|nr:hypothetical protein PLESTM_000731400 [Pleodorina starrii]GLC61189.1 hypothetical protein PLESTB_001729200 [Pleodorina starrii]GLC75745.1 hypothetical protein PLESTF_001680800 [Pleodorina starrii]
MASRARLTVNKAALAILENASRNSDALLRMSHGTLRSWSPVSDGDISLHAAPRPLSTAVRTQSSQNTSLTRGVPLAKGSSGGQASFDVQQERHMWTPQEREILVQAALQHSAGMKAPLDRLLQQLGWDSIPDPEGRIRQKLRIQYSKARAMIDNGLDPLQVGVKKKLTLNRTISWVAWARQAFESLPDGEGTLDDVCAFLQADPKIAPLLDTRPYMNLRTVPRWRMSVGIGLQHLRGLVNTGEKRGGLALYRYNPQDAIVDTCGAGALKRRRQPAGLPFLGKRSKN